VSEGGERIAKVMARAGLCSRRDAERWIAEGRVSVNGRVLDSPALVVGAGDDVRVDGKPLAAPERMRLWRYHKPAGLVTTHRDEKGRRTVFEALPATLPRVISVGRLDLNSEGLLLLTNDGGLARRLELPATGWVRRYRVRVHGAPDAAALAGLAKGITIEGVAYGPIEARLDKTQGSNAWVTVALREGKNREVRRVLEHLGLPVTRLIRLAYGPFQLGHLPRGAVEEVPGKVLKEQLGTAKDADRRR
jgi:23S rRNA pseudouridine2605 synthase